MNWIAQTLHVARKDARRNAGLIGVYCALVVVATASALDVGLAPAGRIAWPLLIALVGVVLFAVIIQADSPSRIDAFWVTRPLHPSAVFAAKLLLAAVLVLGIPLAGELVAWRGHDTSLEQLPAGLSNTALSYASWLLMAGVLAALTRDLRMFVVALVLVMTAGQFAPYLAARLLGVDLSSYSEPPRTVTAAAIAAFILVLGYQYRARSRGPGIVLTAAIMLGTLLASLALRPAADMAPAELRAAVRLESAGLHSQTPGVQLQVSFDRRTELLHQYLLQLTRAHLRMPDGSVVHIDVHGSTYALASGEVTFRGTQVPGAAVPPPVASPLTALWLPLDRDQTDVVVRNDARLTVDGYVSVREPQVLGELPLQPGAQLIRGGHRIRIIAIRDSARGPVVDIQTSSVLTAAGDGSRFGDVSFTERYSFTVVGAADEPIPLVHGRRSASSVGLVAFGSDAVTAAAELTLRERFPADTSAQPTAASLRGARLQVVAWISRGNYPVTFEVADVRPLVTVGASY